MNFGYIVLTLWSSYILRVHRNHMQSDGPNNSGGSALYSLRRGTCLAVIAVYPVLHVAAVWLGLFLSAGTQTATLWTSNALLLAVMVILGKRWWVPLLISLLAAETFTIAFLTSHLPLSVAMHFSAANMLEAMFAALLWQKMVKGPINIFRLRDCLFLIFIVAVSAPAIGGLLAGFGQSGMAESPGFFRFWQLWWLANLLGILLITTTILAWAGAGRDDWRFLDSRRYELVALVVLVTGLALWVFGSEPGSIGIVLGLPYVIFPLLIWSTVRFGTRVSITLVLLIAMVSVINTDSGVGPYAIPSYTVYQRVLSLQMFLTAAAIS
ncbi:MAG: MASE1 domain-containing protein, partial [Gammaproteobacteria bacterium]|nr:MASE1 domain-containing protein [Gammaproteobacteria bacterium]